MLLKFSIFVESLSIILLSIRYYIINNTFKHVFTFKMKQKVFAVGLWKENIWSNDCFFQNQCKPFSNQRGRPLQRTLSDESLHSTKGVLGTPTGDLTIGKDVLFTTALPARSMDSSSGSDPASVELRLVGGGK